MPVATAVKVEALRRDLRSGAAVADLLGVSRSRVTRWLQGAGIDPLNAERVDLLELVWSSLLRVYEPEAAREWLLGANPNLDDRRPIDLVRAAVVEIRVRSEQPFTGRLRLVDPQEAGPDELQQVDSLGVQRIDAGALKPARDARPAHAEQVGDGCA